ncbi:MAG: hypothetical protein JJ902_06505 [Roseibium sp.]|nr:hypothetical protein [Roseibium sp.]
MIEKSSYNFSRSQLKFLDLFKIAAEFDCLYLLDFYCFDLFDHDQIGKLNEREQAELADAARREIFEEALAKGYEPPHFGYAGGSHDRLC